MARILLTTFGSYGDLHPYIAIALALRERGHAPVLASHPFYREKVEAAGIDFRPLRSSRQEKPDAALMRRVMDIKRGPELIMRELVMPGLRNDFEDTMAAAEGADLLVSHPLTFATPMVAQLRKLPWASSVLAPMSIFSAYDPPMPPMAPWVIRLRFLGPGFFRAFGNLAKSATRSWTAPVDALRAELKLPPAPNPLFEGQHSPYLVLALFSELLGAPQPDWPANTVVTGFPLYDEDGESELSPELAAFLDAGPPPIVFTLGSSAVMDPGMFFQHSAAAAQALGRRAVLLVGREPQTALANMPGSIGVFGYAPYSRLFPRAAAVVHQGGVGTTAQAMRAGRPMLVMPCGFDQPDNAERVRRLGIARVVPRGAYDAGRATRELTQLLDDPGYAQRAREVVTRMRGEGGARVACDQLERLLR